jgi:SAM-dependent methyltransferase
METGQPPRRFALRPLEACWVCGHTHFDSVFHSRIELIHSKQFGERAHNDHPTFQINRCRQCRFAQPSAMPQEPDYFPLLYQQEWGSEMLERYYDYGDKDYIFRTILARLEKLPQVHRTLLDVGTFVGRFVEAARSAGWDAEGLETNERAVAVARRRTGATIHQGTAETLSNLGRRYGVVVFTDVLEHIPDPLPVLRSLRQLTLPGGWIAVKVPQGASQRFKEGLKLKAGSKKAGVGTSLVHVNHFTPHSLKLALTKAGFEQIKLYCGAPEFPPAARRRGLKQQASVALRLASYRLANLLPGGLNTPLAFNLQAYARNPQ